MPKTVQFYLVVLMVIFACHLTCADLQIKDQTAKELLNTLKEVAENKNFSVIFPGTKWCGVNDIAEHDDDLGIFEDVDKCCRSHDKCDCQIPAFTYEYGLLNLGPITRLHCQCDQEFHDCLENVNEDKLVATIIGVIYFNLIKTRCFQQINNNETDPLVCLKDDVYAWYDVPQFEVDIHHHEKDNDILDIIELILKLIIKLIELIK